MEYDLNITQVKVNRKLNQKNLYPKIICYCLRAGREGLVSSTQSFFAQAKLTCISIFLSSGLEDSRVCQNQKIFNFYSNYSEVLL